MALGLIPLAAVVVAGSLAVRSSLRSTPTAVASSSTPAPLGSATGPSSPSASLPTAPAGDVPETPEPSTSSDSPEATASEEEEGIEEGTYSVDLSGTVGGRSFQRSAQIRVMPTVARVGTNNGVNPVEVCLRSGFPAGAPEVGAIWFGTNTACFPERGAQLDMTTVSVSGDTVTVEPDGRIAAGGLNNFVDSGSYIGACLYQPVSGSMTVTFSGGSASGKIDITGYSGPCRAVGTKTSYSARFTG
jgi:hypothetical protein